MEAVTDSNITLKFQQNANCSGQNYGSTGIELGSNGTTNAVYDAEGAMKFTIVVVLVYGFAVCGVVALSVIHKPRSKMYQSENDIHNFVKGFDHVRSQIEKRSRVSAVTQLLKAVQGHYNSETNVSDGGLFPGLVFIPLAFERDTDRAETVSEQTIKSQNSYDCIDYLLKDDRISNKPWSLLEPVMEDSDETESVSDETKVKTLDLVELGNDLSNYTVQHFSDYPVITNSEENDKECSFRMTKDSEDVLFYIDVNEYNEKNINNTEADDSVVPV
ncbi:hypothetical protein CHS0354_010999 [Potamilus streckersoni]|uniref:Uncharacterized protein n=1 Tax=Potamilus streckersoni TaxID=2493646 RepID=A0AAE0TL85_9BIVA|nr:hypothetical protein CHS0354_010999 [Potamilus streckersoni]